MVAAIIWGDHIIAADQIRWDQNIWGTEIIWATTTRSSGALSQ